MINILFTSSGRRGYLLNYFREQLKGIGKVFAANSSSECTAFLYADESIVTPLINDENYIPFLLKFCESKKIKLIIPLFDLDLDVLSKNKIYFERQGIKVLVAEPTAILICRDKYLGQKWLRENGFYSLKTYISIEDSLKDIEAGSLNFPLIIKPRWGMGSIGVEVADDVNELNVLYKKVKKVILNSYLKYEPQLDIDHAIVIQELLVGQEYGLDIINNLNGDYRATIVKRKLAMRSGETDIAETEYNSDLFEIGKRLATCMRHIGNLDVDIFHSDGSYFILDMNARFGGGCPFSHIAGVDLPRTIINWLKDPDNPIEYLHYYPQIIGIKEINISELKSI